MMCGFTARNRTSLCLTVSLLLRVRFTPNFCGRKLPAHSAGAGGLAGHRPSQGAAEPLRRLLCQPTAGNALPCPLGSAPNPTGTCCSWAREHRCRAWTRVSMATRNRRPTSPPASARPGTPVPGKESPGLGSDTGPNPSGVRVVQGGLQAPLPAGLLCWEHQASSAQTLPVICLRGPPPPHTAQVWAEDWQRSLQGEEQRPCLAPSCLTNSAKWLLRSPFLQGNRLSAPHGRADSP